ncbi:hypothetical protein EBR57_10330, partial [bacterium]|nr:hypothetical protein [bacterium]
MICVILGLGVLVHALFIVFSSRVMMTSLDRTNDDIVAAYPGLGHYDLRNPIGIPSTLIELVHRSWTKTAIVQSIVVTAILGVIGIEAVTLSEGLEGMAPGSMSMGLIVVAFGAFVNLLAAKVRGSRPEWEFGVSWGLVGALSIVFVSIHDVSARFLSIYWLSMAVSLILFGLIHYESYFKRWVEGRLERFFVIYTLILTWIGSAFWLGGGHAHVLLGINGIGLATIVMLAASVPLMAAYFSQSVMSLNRQYRLLLGQNVDVDHSNSVFKSEVAVGVVTMGTSWVWLFLYMDWMPWVMTHVTNSVTVDRVILTVNRSLDAALTRQNWIETLRVIEFGEVDGLLGMTPANPDFVMGIFIAILLGLVIGIVLLRFTRAAKVRMVRSSMHELNTNDGILEGRAL